MKSKVPGIQHHDRAEARGSKSQRQYNDIRKEKDASGYSEDDQEIILVHLDD